MQVVCLCKKPVEVGEILTGLQVGKKYYEGHYWCIVEKIGEKAVLSAVRAGALPLYRPEQFEGHALKKEPHNG